MKKYLFILAGLLYLLGQGEAEARAVKLGRSTGSGTASGYQQVFDGGTSGGTHATFCPANCASCDGSSCSRCKSGYFLRDGSCVSCPSNASCDGINAVCNNGYSFGKGGTFGGCIKCPDGCESCTPTYAGTSQSGMSCTACNRGYARYYNTTGTNALCCATGYELADGGQGSNGSRYDQCVKKAVSYANMSCVSGYRKVVSSDRACCVPMCQGVSCVSGYTPTATSTGCCCQANTTPTACGAAQVYHPTLKKCVDAVCPINCADMCTGGYCASCKAGYTLNSSGTCSSICTALQVWHPTLGKCVSATCPINCADCTGGYCTSCKTGYTLNSDGGCDKKTLSPIDDTPIGSACDGTSSTPRFCDNGLIRVEGRGCCPSDYASKPGYACYQCAIR